MNKSRVLSRENQQAMDILVRNLPNYPIMNVNTVSEIETNLYTTNTMFFVKENLTTSNLPKGNWLWNKSRPAVNVIIGGNMQVSFYKLNARKTNESGDFFSKIKIWIFSIYVNSMYHSTFFWCETGMTEFQTAPVGLDDLSFLCHYVSPNTAK